MKADKRGMISIETAITFSLVLVLCAVVLSALCLYRTEINMQRAVDQTCEDFKLISPLMIPVADSISFIGNSLPDGEWYTSDTADTLSQIASAIYGSDLYSEGDVSSLILDGTLSELMENDILSGFDSRAGSSLVMRPHYIDTDYDVDYENNMISVSVTYRLNTIIGERERHIYSVIPLYGDFNLNLNGNPDESNQEESIWDSGNFERGEYFREEFGANVPKSFPVVDIYDSGLATSIVSIDLTAPTYSRNSEITQRLHSQIDELADFQGANINVYGEQYSLSASDITARCLLVVIPENSPDTANSAINEAINYGLARGIKVDVVQNGVSNRYSEPANN